MLKLDIPLASYIHSRHFIMRMWTYLVLPTSNTRTPIHGGLGKSYRERRLDKLGRLLLLSLILDVADKRCDDIASSVRCTASAYKSL